MSDNNLDKYMNPKETLPNLFRAAENNDVGEMLAALAEGQSLSEQDPKRLKMTPVHVAAARSSNDFLGAAAQHETFNPNIVDANHRPAIAHANAHMNLRGHEILFDAMFADLHAPDDRYLDYTDNEPSEFYPG